MPLAGEVEMNSGKSESMPKESGTKSRVEAATRWQNVEIRIGNRRGVGGGRDGRKGWPAWKGPMPAHWIDWWVRKPSDNTSGLEEMWQAIPVPSNRDCVYLYAETIPEDPDERPVWEQLRDIVQQRTTVEDAVASLRREEEELTRRRQTLLDQVRDAESRCSLAQQGAEMAQNFLLQERQRVHNELVALAAHLQQRRELAVQDEARLQEQTNLALKGVAETVEGLKSIGAAVLQADAIQANALVSNRLKAASRLEQSLDLDEALAAKSREIRERALREDSVTPSAGSKLADAVAGVVNQNTLGELLKFGLIVFGKSQPPG